MRKGMIVNMVVIDTKDQSIKDQVKAEEPVIYIANKSLSYIKVNGIKYRSIDDIDLSKIMRDNIIVLSSNHRFGKIYRISSYENNQLKLLFGGIL